MKLLTDEPTPVVFEIDDSDYESVRRYVWWIDKKNEYPTTSYRNGVNNTSTISLHVFLLGKAPKPFEWDHRDRDKLNNHRSNLRLVTRAINARNTGLRSTNTSGVKGVCWDNTYKKWKVEIGFDNQRKNLGYFTSLEEATKVRLIAEELYWGDRR